MTLPRAQFAQLPHSAEVVARPEHGLREALDGVGSMPDTVPAVQGRNGVVSGRLLLAVASVVGVEYPLGRWACESFNPLGGGGGFFFIVFLVIPVVAAVLAVRATWPIWKWPSLALGVLAAGAAFAVGLVGSTDAGCSVNL